MIWAPELADLMTSDALPEIRDFPFAVNANVTLRIKGGDEVAIVVRDCEIMTTSRRGSATYASEYGPKRGLVVVRIGRQWVGVFLKDGRLLVTATK